MGETLNAANKVERKRYPVLDLDRFIAALIIIFIHIFPEGSTTSSIGLDNSIPMLLTESFIYPILRIAAPIFFVISSFLLFQKVKSDPNNKWKYVGSFCLRLLFLYLFWYIVGLPITIKDIVGYASSGDTYNLLRYFVLTLWKGAPRGYWFLVALALSIVITSLANSKKSLIILTVIAGLLFIYGCFNSSYFGLLASSDVPFIKALYNIGEYLELAFCPLEALIFVVLGKIFALYGPFKIKGNIFWIILSFFLLAGEVFLVLYFNLLIYPDVYILLPLFVFFFINLIIGIENHNERFISITKKLKEVGSFSYLFHLQFFVYLHWILDSTGYNIFRDQIGLLLIPYVVCVLLCFLLQTLFERLSSHRYLGFLRYSY